MNQEKEGEEAGRAWQRAHPAEARAIAEALVGTFAFKKCHENRPGDLLRSNCFRELLRYVRQVDSSLAAEMSSKGYGWTAAWVQGLRRVTPEL